MKKDILWEELKEWDVVIYRKRDDEENSTVKIENIIKIKNGRKAYIKPNGWEIKIINT